MGGDPTPAVVRSFWKDETLQYSDSRCSGKNVDRFIRKRKSCERKSAHENSKRHGKDKHPRYCRQGPSHDVSQWALERKTGLERAENQRLDQRTSDAVGW